MKKQNPASQTRAGFCFYSSGLPDRVRKDET
jgi:hypothetical protein